MVKSCLHVHKITVVPGEPIESLAEKLSMLMVLKGETNIDKFLEKTLAYNRTEGQSQEKKYNK